MPIQTSYSYARASLASLWNEVTQNREMVIIQRRGAEDVVLISADELAGLLEAAHLLRSRKNAERLLRALARAERGEGSPQSVQALKEKAGLGEEE